MGFQGRPSASAEPDDEVGGEYAYVWGTNVNIPDVLRAIRRFLINYRPTRGDFQSKYIQLIEEVGNFRPVWASKWSSMSVMRDGEFTSNMLGSWWYQTVEREEDTVNIDMTNLFDHDPDLYAKVVRYPLDIIPLLDTECQEIATHFLPTFEKHIEVCIDDDLYRTSFGCICKGCELLTPSEDASIYSSSKATVWCSYVQFFSILLLVWMYWCLVSPAWCHHV